MRYPSAISNHTSPLMRAGGGATNYNYVTDLSPYYARTPNRPKFDNTERRCGRIGTLQK